MKNSSIETVIIFVKELPQPVKLTTYFYLTSIFCYNFFGTYSDSKMYLDKFRDNNLTAGEKKEITDEWSAVKYGANKNFGQRVWESFFWPITLSKNIVPWMVLTLNKKKTV